MKSNDSTIAVEKRVNPRESMVRGSGSDDRSQVSQVFERVGFGKARQKSAKRI